MFSPTQPFSQTVPFGPTEPWPADPAVPSRADRFGSTLSPSLLSDLNRFADAPGQMELLPALAACVRHGRPLRLVVRIEGRDMALDIDPRDQQFGCAVDLCALPADGLAELALVRVEPHAGVREWAEHAEVGSLSRLTWLLAEHGASDELLPEIAGPVRYRLSPTFEPGELPVEASAVHLLQRMRSTPSSLDELGAWTVRGPARVRRLLNALYLQSMLIVSRLSAPAARF